MLKDKPLVSVIIPSYNHFGYIKECVESVIAQDYENVELIIIDDGSKDGSVSQIKLLADICEQRFTRFEFRARENKGLSQTLNEAIEWIRGDYLCIVASDDVILKHKISMLVPYLESNEKVPAIFGGAIIVDSRGDPTGKKIKLRNGSCSFKDLILLKVSLPAVGAVIRVSQLKLSGSFDPEAKVEDLDMWLRLTQKGQSIKTLKTMVAKYRRHETNFSAQMDVMHEQISNTLYKYKDHPLYNKSLNRLSCLVFRDTARADRRRAIRYLRDVYYIVWDPRLYQGLIIVLFGR